MIMIIMKFGGSSLANSERIRHVAEIVEAHLHEKPILVLSAMGRTTDDLLESGQAALLGTIDIIGIKARHMEIAKDLKLTTAPVEALLDELSLLLKGISLIGELTQKTKAHLLSFGERLSTCLFSAHLCQRGLSAEVVNSWDVGLVTTADYHHAEPLPESYESIFKNFGQFKNCIPVVTGFIAKDKQGSFTTLGRGGSDCTAAIFGAALQVKEIQVWKDVHGILSTDPRVCEEAYPVPYLSFEEASELAYFGAKILHPRSILPAMNAGISVRVKNSFDPFHPGTLIVSKVTERKGIVTSITYKPNQVMVHICSTRMLGQYGFLAKVFQIFADLRISVDVIATSEVSITLTLENQEGLVELERRLEEIATIRLEQNRTMISLIGSQDSSLQILEKSLKTLSQAGVGVQMISHGASNINTSLVVHDEEAKRSIRLLHEQFFQDRGK